MDDIKIHTWAHCRSCVEGRQTERLEAGLSTTGVVITCKKHGIVTHLSPTQLAAELAAGPRCDCCPGGRHSN